MSGAHFDARSLCATDLGDASETRAAPEEAKQTGAQKEGRCMLIELTFALVHPEDVPDKTTAREPRNV